ncbi:MULTISPECIES: TldD protein [Aeromonas]|nr:MULTISPECIES: TldD protein [Aeromonas]MCH7372736.1 TldD protein [Aeromonas sp. MR16]
MSIIDNLPGSVSIPASVGQPPLKVDNILVGGNA